MISLQESLKSCGAISHYWCDLPVGFIRSNNAYHTNHKLHIDSRVLRTAYCVPRTAYRVPHYQYRTDLEALSCLHFPDEYFTQAAKKSISLVL